jgi:hypothetical protein
MAPLPIGAQQLASIPILPQQVIAQQFSNSVILPAPVPLPPGEQQTTGAPIVAPAVYAQQTNTLPQLAPIPLPPGQQQTASAPIVANAVWAQNNAIPPDRIVPPPLLPPGVQQYASIPSFVLAVQSQQTFPNVWTIPDAIPVIGGAAPDYKKKRIVRKIGNRLVVFPSAADAINSITQEAEIEQVPRETVTEPVEEIKIADVKETAKRVSSLPKVNKLLREKRYNELLALYEQMLDDEDIELILLSL